jgi:D-aminopeptidase
MNTYWHVGQLPAGPRDTIADVPGVQVGHCTLSAGAIQTGVTVLRAHCASHYLNKVPAAATVINGFGKSVGLMQIEELGVLETPIALTNTFSVSAVAHAQIRQAIGAHPEIGRSWPTVNPLVFECNDRYLNDIQAFAVTPEHFDQAHDAAGEQFLLGAHGAGRGMSCFGLKGGIGSASRLVTIRTEHSGPQHYTVGALVLSNFGHGSGDISLAFSTAYTRNRHDDAQTPVVTMVAEQSMNALFEAAADATEQGILSSLWHAETVTGRDGHVRRSLRETFSDTFR